MSFNNKIKNNIRKFELNRDNYAYSTGRFRALEADLLTKEEIYRIFDATDISDIARILADNGFDITNGIEQAVREDLKESYALALELIPDKEFVDALLLYNDYHNLKVILKSFIPGNKVISDIRKNDAKEVADIDGKISQFFAFEGETLSIEEIRSDFAYPSKYNPDKLLETVRNDSKDYPDSDFPIIIKDAFKSFVKYSDPGDIDAQVDKYYYIKLAQIDSMLNNDFFSQYRSFKADSTNLLILLRLRAIKADPSRISNLIVEGGEIDSQKVIDLYKKSDENIKIAYKGTSCEKLALFASTYGTGNTAMEFGKAVDNHIIAYLYKTRFILFGPEIILAYLIAKDMQAKNINIASTCVRNNVPKSFALEMMRNTN